MAAFAMLIAVAGTRAAAASLSLAAFVGEIDRLRESLPVVTVDSVSTLRDSIPAVWVVEHDGQRFEVSGAAIRRALDEGGRDAAEWPRRRDAIAAQLMALRAEAERVFSAERALEPQRLRAALQRVLARKEFARIGSETVISQLRRRITEWLVRLWERLGGSAIGGRRLATIVAWVAVLLALGVLCWWLVVTLLRANRRSGLALEAPRVRRRSAHAWAQDAAGAADPRQLVRYAYRAAVAALEEEGTWRADAARTPREHLHLLPAAHRRRSQFADIARAFEEVWFGARRPTPDDTTTVLARLRELGCLPAD